MLRLTNDQRDAIIATCIRALPDEGCGLVLGAPDGTVVDVVPSDNVAHSAKLYEIDSRVMLHASRRSEDEGLVILGVFHSHTHSAAYPSPTDVRLAPDPAWHYVLVSLLEVPSDVRSYRIIKGVITEEEFDR